MDEPIRKLWEEFRNDPKNYDLRNRLIKHYSPLVHRRADRIHAELNDDKINRDDLVSIGYFGLIDAINNFDPDGGVTFEAYSLPRIHGAIMDEIRELDWLPRLIRARMNRMNKENNPDSTETGPEDREGRDGEQG